MSEETARQLAQAQQAHREQDDKVQTLIAQTLSQVAAQFGERVDAHGKKLAHNQPDVTKRLGRDGVTALREDLATVVEGVSERFRNGTGRMQWPKSSRRPNAVANAMAEFLTDDAATIDRIFATRGYDVRHGITGWGLIGYTSEFPDLEREFLRLHERVSDVEKSQAADDRDTVDDLWD